MAGRIDQASAIAGDTAAPARSIRMESDLAATRAWSDRGGHVRLEFLQSWPEEKIEWRIARPELSLLWVRNAGSQVDVNVGGRTLSFWPRGKASLCFFPAGVSAEARFSPGVSFQCAGLFLGQDFLASPLPELPTQPLVGFQHEGLDQAFASLLPELGKADHLLPLLTRACAMQAIAYVARNAAPAPRRRGGLAPWQQRRATDMLQAEFGGYPSVEEVAQACKLSSSHFARCFQASTGQSPHRWLLQTRIRKAQELMLEGPAPLADIALACGFADQSHFSRTFRRVHDTTPNAWRRARAADPVTPLAGPRAEAAQSAARTAR